MYYIYVSIYIFYFIFIFYFLFLLLLLSLLVLVLLFFLGKCMEGRGVQLAVSGSECRLRVSFDTGRRESNVKQVENPQVPAARPCALQCSWEA